MQTSEPETPKSTERRGSFRVPLSKSSQWEFRLKSGFFDAVASDLGEGGMFVNITDPQLEGSEIDFEVRFGGGAGLIRGRAEVAWVCDRESHLDHALGMGIRFLDLDRDSREVVRSAIEKRFFSRDPLAIHDVWTGEP